MTVCFGEFMMSPLRKMKGFES